MSQHADLVKKLRTPQPGQRVKDIDLDKLAAAVVIESLEFQLSCRIGVARAEAKESVA